MDNNEYLESVEFSIGVKMIPCESSNIVGYGYHNALKTLWVAFKGNRVYKHIGVPKDIYLGLHAANSKGRYYNANIKGQFEITCYEVRN